MGSRLAVIGGGGFGREVLDLIEAINAAGTDAFEVVGIFDDGEPDQDLLKPYGIPHAGPTAAIHDQPGDVAYVIAVGSPQAKRTIDEQCQASDRSSPVLVHPSVVMGREVNLGPGTIVCANSSITNHIRLGRHVHVNLNCTIGHDTTLDDYVTLSPSVSISGNVHARTGAFFGTGCKVNPRLAIGENSVVGTGAAVIKPVEAGRTVVGVPAKPRG